MQCSSHGGVWSSNSRVSKLLWFLTVAFSRETPVTQECWSCIISDERLTNYEYQSSKFMVSYEVAPVLGAILSIDMLNSRKGCKLLSDCKEQFIQSRCLRDIEFQ